MTEERFTGQLIPARAGLFILSFPLNITGADDAARVRRIPVEAWGVFEDWERQYDEWAPTGYRGVRAMVVDEFGLGAASTTHPVFGPEDESDVKEYIESEIQDCLAAAAKKRARDDERAA